ncbi:HupE/UreJ family protein [Paenibacillus sp. MMO-58]|uniref:HupE/UreJ family protein n=1 Tax=Paenibacillus sp. MMO-58 TaxID=3081290 RepID=UPI00301885B9
MNKISRSKRLIMSLLFMSFPLMTMPGIASAHPLSASYTEITFEKDQTKLDFSLDELSVLEKVDVDTNGDGKLDQNELTANQATIIHFIEDSMYLEVGQQDQAGKDAGIEFSKKNDMTYVTVHFIYPAVPYGETVHLNDGLYYNDGNTNYANLLVAKSGSDVSQAILTGKDRDWTMIHTEPQVEQGQGPASDSSSAAAANTAQSQPEATQESAAKSVFSLKDSAWLSFFKLGMHHILGGYDHLLFLLALLLGRQTFKQYAATITAFTIAHSITLTLTYLNVLHFPSTFIESVIAFSIVYVAIENIFFKKVRFRWLVTFAFGLIHGMGFADILLGMDIPKPYVAIDLASFNIGIEVIQLCLIALAVPVIRYAQRYKGYFRTVQAASILIAAAGAFWLYERLL